MFQFEMFSLLILIVSLTRCHRHRLTEQNRVWLSTKTTGGEIDEAGFRVFETRAGLMKKTMEI